MNIKKYSSNVVNTEYYIVSYAWGEQHWNNYFLKWENLNLRGKNSQINFSPKDFSQNHTLVKIFLHECMSQKQEILLKFFFKSCRKRRNLSGAGDSLAWLSHKTISTLKVFSSRYFWYKDTFLMELS